MYSLWILDYDDFYLTGNGTHVFNMDGTFLTIYLTTEPSGIHKHWHTIVDHDTTWYLVLTCNINITLNRLKKWEKNIILFLLFLIMKIKLYLCGRMLYHIITTSPLYIMLSVMTTFIPLIGHESLFITFS